LPVVGGEKPTNRLPCPPVPEVYVNDVHHSPMLSATAVVPQGHTARRFGE
jgi:hypothetical protein